MWLLASQAALERAAEQVKDWNRKKVSLGSAPPYRVWVIHQLQERVFPTESALEVWQIRSRMLCVLKEWVERVVDLQKGCGLSPVFKLGDLGFPLKEPDPSKKKRKPDPSKKKRK